MRDDVAATELVVSDAALLIREVRHIPEFVECFYFFFRRRSDLRSPNWLNADFLGGLRFKLLHFG
jgi:hypothetical protein